MPCYDSLQSGDCDVVTREMTKEQIKREEGSLCDFEFVHDCIRLLEEMPVEAISNQFASSRCYFCDHC